MPYRPWRTPTRHRCHAERRERDTLGLAATSLQSMGVPEGTPAAAVEGVRMMIEDALRTGRGEDPLERSEAQNMAYERLGEFLTESCGTAG
ncbi:hypothetical protein NBCG_01114 [Nocardioidaceae bacterium Broad-1]|nr:hypothetical protein NBCG_01114 [Nocardioidaceae bacterium Broad-1]